MPLGTLDRTPPPFFKQGASALSKLLVFSALSVFLMVSDGRFQISQPLRSALGTILMPLQSLVMQPISLLGELRRYAISLEHAVLLEAQARQALLEQAQRSMQVEQLELENQQLRNLLGMRQRAGAPAMAAQVLHDTADPYTRRVIIDKGLKHGVKPGSPVIDDVGVLGQVTQVHPLLSEVTLLIDRRHAIPVLNARTGVRGVAYGQKTAHGEGLELRYTLSNVDVNEGDLLTTSGVDGVYPPGLAVARITQVERRAESTFTRILCQPLARMNGALHVLVLDPVAVETRQPSASSGAESAPALPGSEP